MNGVVLRKSKNPCDWSLNEEVNTRLRDWEKVATRNQYEVNGVYKLSKDKVRISELPVGTWTQSYKDFVEENLIDAPTPKGCFFVDYKEYHTDVNVDFEVTIVHDKLVELEKKGFEKSMKLVTTLSVNNLMAFGSNGKITKYETILDMMQEFYEVRLEYYNRRKQHLLALLTEEFEILDNKVRFIEAVINDTIHVRGRVKKAIVAELEKEGFKRFILKAANKQEEENDDREIEEGKGKEEQDNELKSREEGGAAGYDYLLRMAIWSLTKERADQLRRLRDSKFNELEKVRSTEPKQMWKNDLEDFLASYDEFEVALNGKLSKPSLLPVPRRFSVQQAASPVKEEPLSSNPDTDSQHGKKLVGTGTAKAKTKKRLKMDSKQEKEDVPAQKRR